MSDAPAQTENNATRRQLPGQMLKQAREKLGLTQKDIAAQLNLQIETIDAVEKDDKNRLPVAAYVRGYIRSYARLLKMDGDLLIRLYEQASVPPPEIIPNIKKSVQASSRDKPVRAITYLITFTLALLLLAWLQNKYIVDKNPGAAMNSSIGERSYPSGQNPETETATATASPRGTTATIREPLLLPPGTSEISESVISETGSSDVPVIDTTIPAAPTIDPAQITEHLITGGDTLQFNLTRDSWIEVHDTNKAMLYHDLARAGNEIKLAGKAPFTVVLGYAPGVAVRFNNEPFDPAPYTNAGIARFNLGAKDNQ